MGKGFTAEENRLMKQLFDQMKEYETFIIYKLKEKDQASPK